VGTFAAFLIGGLVGIVLLAAGRAPRRTAVPFGPSMLLGALAAVLWGEQVTAWYLS
jgi:leader peptidase (prepilin peptidase)/N-methyltransferase